MRKTLQLFLMLGLFTISLNSFAQYNKLVYGISLAFDNAGVVFKFDQDNPSAIDSLSYVNERYYQSGEILNGKWYAVSAFQGQNELWVIDTLTGVETKVADLSQALVGITYSVITQKMYACDNTNLYTLDVISGELTLIGAMGNVYCMKGLASNNNGEIYGIEWANSNIYRIDPLTGQASSIAVMTDTIVYPLDGKLNRNTGEYILSSMTKSSRGTFHLYKINLQTGETTDMGEVAKTAQLTALAIPYEVSEQSKFNGYVRDTENNPIKNAKVTISSSTSSLITVTNDTGYYDFPVVYPGIYNFKVVAKHYLPTSQENISIELGENLAYDFSLTLSELSVSFTVTNSDLEPISGTVITLVSDTLKTNAQGKAIYEHVSPGKYPYKVEYQGYFSNYGEVNLTDASLEIPIKLIKDSNIKRNLVILEEGTGTWCTYCPAAANGLDELHEKEYPVAIIAYHSGDDYETTEGAERLEDYLTTGYPTVYFDGTTRSAGGAGADESMFEVYAPIVEQKIEVTTPVDLKMEDITYNSASRTFTAKVKMNVMGVVFGQEMRLQVALTESGIAESWKELDSLHFVERAMFNGSVGTTVDLATIGSEITVPVTFTLNETWKEKRCQVIAFVQDNESKEILNGYKIDLADFITDAISENEEQFSIYPNPANDEITLMGMDESSTISILNINGQALLNICLDSANGHKINLNNLKSGVYLLKVTNKLTGKSSYNKLVKN